MNLDFGCLTCNHSDADKAWNGFLNTKIEASYIDESHFSIRVRQCPECKQKYLSVFTETIDWKDGEDPQLWSIIPISPEEQSQLNRHKDEYELIAALKQCCPNRKSLCLDWPKGTEKKVFWTKGAVIGLHD